MNEVEKMKREANRVAVINAALDRTGIVICKEYIRIHDEQSPALAIEFLASLCATVIGTHLGFVQPETDEATMKHLVQSQFRMLGDYIADNNNPLMQVSDS